MKLTDVEKRILKAATEIMEKVATYHTTESPMFTTPEKASTYFTTRIGTLEHEVFCVAYLDNQNKLRAVREEFRGTIDGARVYPREVVKTALELNAAAVVFAHNHPSCSKTPSQSDIAITTRLKDALRTVDIRVLDHLIVTPAGAYYSFAEKGML